MSSIFCCGLAAINVQPNGSFTDCCAVKAKQPFRITADKQELCCCSSDDSTLCQQSRRDFAAAHSDQITTNASIQKLNAFCRSTVSSGVFLLHDIC